MKLFKHMEPMLMLAFFLLCALGALQIGAPHTPAVTGDLVDNTNAQPPGARSRPSAAMPMQTQMQMQTQRQMQMPMQTQRPMQMPVLTPMPTPMPVVHIIGRRMTDAEKRAAASAG